LKPHILRNILDLRFVASRAEAWIEKIRANLRESASHSVASRVAKKEAGNKV
jgi:hypothetical protein